MPQDGRALLVGSRRSAPGRGEPDAVPDGLLDALAAVMMRLAAEEADEGASAEA